jgi:hypothetical protein
MEIGVQPNSYSSPDHSKAFVWAAKATGILENVKQARAGSPHIGARNNY